MIRWYDWVVAIIAADSIVALFIGSITGDNIWVNIIYGLMAGFVYSAFTVDYCHIRKKQEQNR